MNRLVHPGPLALDDVLDNRVAGICRDHGQADKNCVDIVPPVDQEKNQGHGKDYDCQGIAQLGPVKSQLPFDRIGVSDSIVDYRVKSLDKGILAGNQVNPKGKKETEGAAKN